MGSAGYCYCIKKSMLVEPEKAKHMDMLIQTEEIDKDNTTIIYVKFVVNFNKTLNMKDNSEIIFEAFIENLWLTSEESLFEAKSAIQDSKVIFDKIEFPYNFQERTLISIHLYPFDSQNSQTEVHSQSFEFKLNLTKLIQERDFLCIPLFETGKSDYAGEVLVYSSFHLDSLSMFLRSIIKVNLGCTNNMFFSIFNEISINHKNFEIAPSYISEIKDLKQSNTFNLSISTKELCANNLNKRLRMDFIEQLSREKTNYIGSAYFSINDLREKKLIFEIKNRKSQIVGNVIFNDFSLEKMNALSSFVKSGLNIQTSIGIDFSKSNKVSKEPDSLHSNIKENNVYLKSLEQIFPLLMDYTEKGKTPFWGFGAKIPPFVKDRSSHCFSLTGNIYTPEVDDINKLSEYYLKILKRIKFFGPTLFSPLIKFCNERIIYDLCKNIFQYYLLIIITDGKIDDLEETIDELVESSYLPFSIIIIGVGIKPFEGLQGIFLEHKLFSKIKNKYAERNNISFIDMENCKTENAIRIEALRHIPIQIESYMYLKNKTPNDLLSSRKLFGQIEIVSYFEFLERKMKEELLKLNRYNKNHIEELFKLGLIENSIELATTMLNLSS